MSDAGSAAEKSAKKEVLLEARGLSKGFGKRKQFHWAVRDVNLALYRGECLGLAGESGCGKTTLARMLASLLPPDEGQIFFCGRELGACRRAGGRRFFRRIQVVFQDPVSAFSPRMNMETFLTEGLRHFGLPGAALPAIAASQAEAASGGRRLPEGLFGNGRSGCLHAEAVRLLDMVGLGSDFCGRRAHELSGGELQRVVIARAISVRPDILILDEPTSALDVSTQQEILNLLVRLRRETGVSCLFISHNLAVVRRFCDRTVFMQGGQLQKTDARGAASSISPSFTKAL